MSFADFTLKDLVDQGTTYGEVVDMLRADLQLDASTDLLPASVGPVSTAPQTAGQVSVVNLVTPNASTQVTGFSTLADGSYSKASATGLTVTHDGIYLAVARCRWDTGAGGTFRATNITKNAGALVSNEAVSGPLSTIGPGHMLADLVTCAAGDVLGVLLNQNTGGNVTTAAIDLQAIWLSNH